MQVILKHPEDVCVLQCDEAVELVCETKDVIEAAQWFKNGLLISSMADRIVTTKEKWLVAEFDSTHSK